MAYQTWNGPAPTTAAQQQATTGTAIKTMLQLATSANKALQVIEWGYSIDDPSGADGVVELIQTDVSATVTAHVAAGIVNLDTTSTSSLTLGVAATGYTSSSEGSITATRVLDTVSLPVSTDTGITAPSALYVKQFMPDARPIIPVSKFLRVRATTPTSAVDMRCYIVWAEL